MSRVIGQYPDVNWLIDKLVGSESYKTACSKTDLCVNQMRVVLCSQQLPENASMEIIGRAYHATETFCKIDAFVVWNAWGLALIQMEHYAKDHVKFKQALQLFYESSQEESHFCFLKISSKGKVNIPFGSVAERCAGLSITIITVARALRDKSKHAWRDVLRQLKNPPPKNIKVYLKNMLRLLLKFWLDTTWS
ncbi:hypothetical protein L6452_06322 [Arctium lappa]|uniref:Uncharacterized protein n=1 Tax=Arctium lappa TaxID=4217 RepID=A0ACB9EJA6_ARCLA|nr:hypothetical protein L6452_06322 [Arctium lappa]